MKINNCVNKMLSRFRELFILPYGQMMILIFWWIVQFSANFASGGVEIVKPYHPLYVKSGSNLTITCESRQRTELKWYQQTPKTSWADKEVQAMNNVSNIVIQTFREEPSGFTRSTLVKRDMSLGDRGTYICKDDTSSYAVWVTVLYIRAEYLTSLSRGIDPLILGCTISGFDSNVPTIDYDWTFNDLFIPHPHYEVPVPVRHSPLKETPPEKFRVRLDSNDLRLEIYKPTSFDGGSYNCVFTLGTSLGPVTYFESLYINGSLLKPGISRAERSITPSVSLLIFSIMAVIPFLRR